MFILSQFTNFIREAELTLILLNAVIPLAVQGTHSDSNILLISFISTPGSSDMVFIILSAVSLVYETNIKLFEESYKVINLQILLYHPDIIECGHFRRSKLKHLEILAK